MGDDEARMRMAGRLKQAREYLGFTQEQVADHLDIHRPSVSEFEAGRRWVTSGELVKLAKLYGRTVEYFLGTEAPPEASREIAELAAGLDETDRAEIVEFAQWLAFRKKSRKG